MSGENQKNNRVIILLLVFLFQMGISALLLNTFSMENWSAIYAEDSEGYLSVARYFAGEESPPASVPLLKYRLFSPVVPLMASLLARLLPLEYAFLVLNACLWLISIFLFYRFSETLLNKKLAYYCALLFATSLPLIIWGLPIMVDTASFFFAVLNCLLITRFTSDKRPLYLIIGLTLSVAILAKPNLVSLLLFFIAYAGFQKQYLRIVPVVCSILMLVGGVYLYFGLRVEDFQAYGYLRHRGFFYVLNAAVFCFHWGIPLAGWGGWLEKKQKKFYLSYFISTFSCYLLFVHNPRLMFIVFPAVLPLVVRGMEACAHRVAHRWHYKPERVNASLVFGYMLTSNILAGIYLYITRVLQYRSIDSL